MCPHRAGQDDPGGRRHPGGAGTAQAAGPVQLFGIRSAGAWNAPAGSTCPLAGGSLPPSRRQRTPGTRQPPATSNAPPRRAARKPRPCGPRARFHLRPFAGSWVGSSVDRHPVFVPDLALRRTVRPCGPVDGAAAKRHGPGRGDRKGSTRQPEHAELHCASNRKTSWLDKIILKTRPLGLVKNSAGLILCLELRPGRVIEHPGSGLKHQVRARL